MEQKVGFLKGLDQDSSVSKRDPNSYYDASNIRVLTDDGLTTGSVIVEKGNKLLFRLPTTLMPVYEVLLPISEGNQDFSITTSIETNTVSVSGISYLEQYNLIMANSAIQDDITAGLYNIYMSGDKLYVVGLTNLTNVTAPYGTVTQLLNTTTDLKIVGLSTMRDWIVVFTTGIITEGSTNTVGNGQIWKCKYNKTTNVIDNLNGDELTPVYHLVYNNILNFDINYRVGEVISRYENSTHGKIFFIDGLNTLKHINILDPNSLGLPLSAINTVPNITVTEPTITKVFKGGSYKSGAVQYSYQLFNESGAETGFAPASGIVHLTTPTDYASNTIDYKGTAPDINTEKAVQVSLTNLDTNFGYVRLVAIYYTSKEGSPEINIVEERAIPSTGNITIIDDGNPISVYTLVQYNTTGNRLFIPGTMCTKNNYLIAGNIKEDYFDIDELYGYWDARAYRWKDSTGQFRIDGNDSADLNVAETADCILTRAEQADYKYNYLTHNLGGNGINISYEFTLNSMVIDNNQENISQTNLAGSTQQWSSLIDSYYSNNDSYTSYASPLNRAQLMGYTRDEIYRFGIVFEDNRGRNSFVKWIGDIKMPHIADYNPETTEDFNTITYDSLTDHIKANILGVVFSVTNVPSGLKWHIVRVRREDNDRYILGQGFLGLTDEVTASPDDGLVPLVSANLNTALAYNTTAYQNMFTFKSPESLFTNSINPVQGDELEIVATGSFNHTDNDISTATTYNQVKVTKIKTLFPTTHSVVVTDGIKMAPQIEATYRYVINNGGTWTRIQNHNHVYKPSALAIGTDTGFTMAGLPTLLLANYKKEIDYIQYGGNNYVDRINNIYINCGHLHTGDDTSVVYNGDTFITMFEVLEGMLFTGSGGSNPDEHSSWLYFPVETTINTELRNGSTYKKVRLYNLCETVDFGNKLYPASGYGIYPADYEDIYQYNTVYSAEPTGKTYSIKPLFFENNKVNDYRIICSEKHINGNIVDNWTKFLYNNILEVNSAYGPITKLITSKNQVLFFQDNAFGLVAFNERQLLNDATGASLVLGVGSILDSYRYISEKTGTKSKFGVTDTGGSVYFIDLNNRKFMRFNGQNDETISDNTGMSSYFRTFDYDNALIQDSTSNNIGIHSVFDPINKRVLYTMLSDNEKNTFSFNEKLGAMESFYSFRPTIFENTDSGVISVEPNDKDSVYIHDQGNRNIFYDTPYQPYITSVFSPNPDNKKVFTNLEFNSSYKDNGIDVPLTSIEYYEIWNSFQDSGVLATSNANLRRRFRTWRMQLPKDSDGLRYLDYYLFLRFFFKTTSLSDNPIDFRLDDITAHYLIPMI